MKTCPSCARENADDARFCSGCGAQLVDELTMREERKVVTCLFCDLVGFTARAERMDPEDVRRLLQPYHARLRSELERFGGTVEKFIGDAVMAVFGAPVAHEDDPERAVRAALAIRDALAEEGELQVRIGITTGEALIALGARPETGEGMASGDVVNTAARIQAAAPIGSILVDQTTYRAAERVIEFAVVEPIEAKGKTNPIPVWEAARARARVGVERVGGAPLVGRERELTLLRETFARLAREREPQLVTLVGVPGIGKSRLVYELFQEVDRSTEVVCWRHGRSLPYGEGITFWALGEMVKAQAGILESDDPESAREKLSRAVKGLLPDPADADWVERHLAALVGVGAEVAAEGDHATEAFAAWRRFLEALADQRLLVLVFEDLHWADEAMLDFVDYLVDWASGVPMLVLATARPELLARRPGWGGGKVNSATILLAPLSQEETSRLVHTLLGRSVLPADVQTELLERAGGNPLYAEEFVRMPAERRTSSALPESVQGIIASRLDTLPREEKELLQNAAVLGKVFWLGALGPERTRLEERLHGLERNEFVRRERRTSVSGEAEYTFRHALVRDVAYEQIPRAERTAKHRAAAEWLESLGRAEDHAELLAHHYLQALEYARSASQESDQLEQRARRALRAAGDRAAALNAFEAAARFYERALALWPREEREWPDVSLAYARVLFTFPDHAFETMERIRTQFVAAHEHEAAAEVAGMVSVAEQNRGNPTRSLALMREARELLEKAAASRSKVAVMAELARLLALGGHPEEGQPLADRAAAMAEELGLLDLQARALTTLGVAKVFVGDLSGLEDLERSRSLAEQASSPRDLARAYVALSAVTTNGGDVRRGDGYARAGLEVAERYGVAPILRFIRGNLPASEYDLGRWDEALRAADAFLVEVEGGLPHYQESNVRGVRAAVRLARDDIMGALTDDERGLEHAREVADPQSLHPALCGSAWIRIQAGHSSEAAALADEVLTLALGEPRSVEIAWPQLAFTLVALGRGDELVELANRADRPSRWRDAARAFASGDLLRAAGLRRPTGSRVAPARARSPRRAT